MANQVISEIVAAEAQAADIISKAQIAAREAAQLAQENFKRKIDEIIAKAKLQAKELVLQKKNFLDTQSVILKQKNEAKYQELIKEAGLKMENAADFIAERILQ